MDAPTLELLRLAREAGGSAGPIFELVTADAFPFTPGNRLPIGQRHGHSFPVGKRLRPSTDSAI